MEASNSSAELDEIPSGAIAPWLVVTPRLRWIILSIIAVLYLGSISPHWYITNDSALYLLLSESLAHGDGYSLWGHPHVHAPPLFPVWLAMLMRLGLGDMIWLNIGMILIALAGFWSIERLVREQASPELALIVVTVFGFCIETLLLSMSQLSDIPFMTLICFGLWNFHRGLRGETGRLEIGTLCLAASCWMRIVGIPLALSAAVGLLLQRREVSARRVWANAISLGVVVGVTLGLFAVWHRTHQGPLPAASYAHHLETLSHRSWGAWLLQPLQNVHETGSQYSRLLIGQELPAWVASLVFTVPTLVGMWCFARRREWLGLITTVGYLASILCLRPILARYLLPVGPFLVLYFLEGIRTLNERVWKARGRGSLVMLGCALILVAVNLPRDLRTVYRLHHPRFIELEGKSWPGLIETAEFLRKHVQPGETFLSAADARKLAYLSHKPHLELSKEWLRQSLPAEQIRLLLDQQSVRYLVFPKDREKWPFFAPLRDMTEEVQSEWQSVFDNSQFRVFRRIDQSATFE